MEESLDALRPTESPAETVPSSEPETIATATTESAAEEAVPAPEEVTRVPNPYADSFLANEDMGAWLQIPGTGIDYPVMWTPRDESYYLYRAFDGSENKNGCLILDTDSCLDPLSTNLIIHGHNMKSGAMFGNLTDYEDPDFYNRYTMAADHAVERVTAITDNIWGVVTGIMASFLVLWTMYRIDPVSVLFVFCPLIGNFLFGNLKNKFEYMRYQEEAPKDKVLNYVNRVLYLPDYAKEIRLSEVFRLLKRQYNEATDEKSDLAGKYAWRIGSMNVLWHFFTFTVMFEGVLLFAIYKNLVIGSMSLADLTVMSSLMVAATWILIGLFNSVMETMKNGLFICNLRTFLEYEEKIPEDQDGILPSKELESLEFENVSFSYKEEETIQGLSFRITHGEKIALVGHNGAGKTTIIKLMLRLYDPAEGTIRVNGIDIRKYNLRAYRELFATAFQDYQLFGVTIRENILMGKHPEKEEQLVAEVLKKVGMYEKVAALSKGIDSVVTREFADDGVVFSGGEGQKIAVARAFAKESPIRIFDEPSSALDPIAEYELFSSIMKDGESHTMIFISHRLSSVKDADRIFMLEQGRLIEEGTHRELIQFDGRYAEMYKKQAMNYLAVESVEGVAL